MTAVYLASSLSSDWLGLVLALSVVGIAGWLSSPTGKRLVLGLSVAGALAWSATAVEAVYINCPPLWKYMGICG